MPKTQTYPLGAQRVLMTPDALLKLGLSQSLPNLKQPVPRTQTGDRAVASGAHFRQSKSQRKFPPRRDEPVETELERNRIPAKRKLDRFAYQRLGIAFEQRLGETGGVMACTFGLASRIARAAFRERPSPLFSRCICSGH